MRVAAHPMTGRLHRTLVATLTVLLAAAGGAARADSLAPPALTGPVAGSTVQANPEFTWAPVDRAAKYRIQVSTNSAFTSTGTWTADVFGPTATPTAELSLGTLHWRVASIDASGTVGAYSPEQTFTKAQADPPALIAPASGAVLSYPSDPAVLSWHAVPGMKSYNVQIDDESTFTAPQSYSTQGTSFALPVALLSNATRFWRVQGVSTDPNVTTAWSDNHDLRTFSIAWPGTTFPSLLTPLDALNTNIDDPDLNFSWLPVPGAADYEVQTSTAPDFTANVTDQVTYATHYRPASAMTQDQYYWRVRARQANAEPSSWSPVKHFKREWLDLSGNQARPAVTSVSYSDPLTKSVEFDKLLITWTPVPRASYYELDISTDPSFTAASTASSFAHRTCKTPHTAWTPYLSGTYNANTAFSADTCAWQGTPTSAAVTHFIVTGGTYFVRVRAVDETPDGHTLTTLWSNAAREGDSVAPDPVSFTVVASTTTNNTDTDATQPAHLISSPDSADTPTLHWQPVQGAVAYYVAIARDSSFNSRVTDPGTYFVTTDTYLTINQVLADNAVGQSYFWFVLPLTNWTDVNVHTGIVGENQAINIPNRWAQFKKLGRAVATNPTATPQTDTVQLSWDDQLRTSQDGGGIKWYEYEVRDAADQVVDHGTTDATGYTPIHKTYADGTYTWRVRAIDASGTALAWGSGTSFDKRSSVPTPLLPDTSSTLPVLSWTPTSFAASYDVEIYRGIDPAFPAGNKVATTSTTARPYPAATLTATLPADTYSWRVRQVDGGGEAGPWSTTILPFTVGGTKPALQSPADGASAQTTGLVYRWDAVPGAVSYRIQSSTTPGFGTTVDNVTTIGTAYAPTATHTGGTTYYWRVAALDAAGNTMATSDPRSFTAVTAPSVPTATSAPQGTSIAVSWSAPADGGSPITGYVVRFRQVGTTAWTEIPVAGDARSTSLGTLLAGTKYEAQVAAVNAGGTSSFSALTSATTVTLPGAPTNLKLTPATHGFIVSWSAPTSTGGGAIAGYAVRVTKAGGTPAESVVTASPTTLTGLEDATAYTVEVAAQNVAGRGPYATVQGTTTTPTTATTGSTGTATMVLTLAGRPKVAFGSPAALTGTFKSSSGSAVTGATVVIQSKPAGTTTWTKVASTVTATGGAFAATMRPLVNTSYRAVSSAIVSSPLAIGVAPKIALARRSVRARVGSAARVAGRVSPSPAGKTLTLRCLSGRKWAPRASGKTVAGGRFLIALPLKTRGSLTCRVAIAASSTHAAGHSPTVTVATS